LSGEAEDVLLSRRPLAEVTLEAVEAMLTKKTGALYAWCARAGATVGGGDEAFVTAVGRFAAACGTAFQHVDDTLAYFADEGETGKAAASDLREGKRTAAVLGAYREASAAERRRMEATLGRAEATAADLAELKETIQALGGLAYARERARSYYEEARRELAAVPAGSYRDWLAAWAAFLLDRTY
jgi:geranylgeranyl pyrophosphate synthase